MFLVKNKSWKPIKQTTVSELLGIAYYKSVWIVIALNGFKYTGIWLCNSDDNFRPSIQESNVIHEEQTHSPMDEIK